MPPKIKRALFKVGETKPEVSEGVPIKAIRKKPSLLAVEDPKVSGTPSFKDLGSPRTLLANGVPCVYVEKGVTKNMGEYNSARVTIGMMLPIDYTSDDLKNAEEAITVIDSIIVKRLEAEVSELLG